MSLIAYSLLDLCRFPCATGFVLAGGASLRMGSAKAQLMIEGETMLNRQIRLLRSIASRVVVVGDSKQFSQKCEVPVVQDVVQGRGPLAGIYTALLETRTEFNVVLGCDLPFVNRYLLHFLATRAIGSGSDVTVPCSRDGRLQPLSGVYRRRALHAIRSALSMNQNKVSSFFPKVSCTVIPWCDLARAGFRASAFSNMNTPEDYEYVGRRLEGDPERLHN